MTLALVARLDRHLRQRSVTALVGKNYRMVSNNATVQVQYTPLPPTRAQLVRTGHRVN
jgi:hypothetical protein